MRLFLGCLTDCNGDNQDWFVRAESITEAKELLAEHWTEILGEDEFEDARMYQVPAHEGAAGIIDWSDPVATFK